MNEEGLKMQEDLHEALVEALPLAKDEILTGWIVIYETQPASGRATQGHFYGPSGMTTWRAVGMIEHCKHRSLLSPDDDEEDENG